MLGTFACGLDSVITAFSNFSETVTQYKVIREAIANGDISKARNAQNLVNSFAEKFQQGNFIENVKKELNLRNKAKFTVGSVRSPMYL